MDLAEFIEDLERRIDADDWTDQETRRLWNARYPRQHANHMVRRHYMDTPEDRSLFIRTTRTIVAQRVAEKLQ